MGQHRALPENMLHEPKGISLTTNGAADLGKVVKALGDGTSEVAFLERTDSPEIDAALTTVEGNVSTAQGDITTLQATVADHESRIVALEEEARPYYGMASYYDNATQVAPLNVPAATQRGITNDALGAGTQTTYLPSGVTQLWNNTTNKFNFTELELGTTVQISIDLAVTTTAANQQVEVYLLVTEGSTPYRINYATNQYKTAGTYPISQLNQVLLTIANVRDEPAQLYIRSDAACTLVVNGFGVSVTGVRATV